MAALPPGSTILLTGANSFVGSHIAEVALKSGYRVRGVVRTQDKADKISAYAQKNGYHFEPVVVDRDFAQEGVFDEVMKGTQALIHCAVIAEFSAPSEDAWSTVVLSNIRSTRSILRSAVTHGLKRVVLTSSIAAAIVTSTRVYQHVDENTWNMKDYERAKEGKADSWAVYRASKVAAEREAWDFVRENKVPFTLNVVLPYACFGPTLESATSYSITSRWLSDLVEGEADHIHFMAPQWSIDVRDVALLHLIALTQLNVKNQRIFAANEPFTWNYLISTIKRLKPDAPNIEPLTGKADKYDHTSIDTASAKKLLAPFGGFRTLEMTIGDVIRQLEGEKRGSKL